VTQVSPPMKLKRVYLDGDSIPDGVINATTVYHLTSFKRHFSLIFGEATDMKKTMDAIRQKDDGNPG